MIEFRVMKELDRLSAMETGEVSELEKHEVGRAV